MRALFVTIALCTVGVAHAGDRAKAEAYFRAGSEAFKNQSYAAAAQQFELALAELALPEIAFSAAQSYRRQYFIAPRPDPAIAKRAVELYRKYLDQVKTGGRVRDASDGLAEMLRELDKHTPTEPVIVAAPAKPATRLAISVVAADARKPELTELATLATSETLAATATLDGKRIELFVPIEVTAGEHAITASADGYFSQSVQRRAVEGVTDLVELALEPRPARLEIATEAGVRIAIDGRAGARSQDVAAGTHVVALTRRGRVPQLRELTLARGERRKLSVELAKTGRRRAVPWAIAGAGALAVVAGAGTVVALRADHDMAAIADKRASAGITDTELREYRRAAGRRDSSRDLAWISGGAAVATALIAGGLYWFDNPSTERIRIVPDATGTSIGAAAAGRF